MKRLVHHPKQIPTDLRTVGLQLDFLGHEAIRALLRCLACEQDGFDRKNHLIAAALILERISCLVYKNKAGLWSKPPVKKYYVKIFESFAETPDEIFERLENRGVTREKAKLIHRLAWQIADLVCPMMANVGEQAFPGEYAYAIEYVICHGGELARPVIPPYSLFPVNYPDYDYTKGIAAEISEYF